MNCFERLLCVSFLMTMMTLSWPFHAVIRASFLTYSDEAQSPTRLVKERDTHIKKPQKDHTQPLGTVWDFLLLGEVTGSLSHRAESPWAP